MSIAVMKHYDQEQLGEERAYLTTPRSQSNIEGSQGRNCSRDMRGKLLAPLGWLSLLFLYTPDYLPGGRRHHAQRAGLCNHHSLIKKMLHRPAYRAVCDVT